MPHEASQQPLSNNSIMKYRIHMFVLFLFVYPFISLAQSSPEERRVEEQKRKNLAPTETTVLKVQEQSEKEGPSSLNCIDQAYFVEFLSRKLPFAMTSAR